jgi:hypothetical protein
VQNVDVMKNVYVIMVWPGFVYRSVVLSGCRGQSWESRVVADARSGRVLA